MTEEADGTIVLGQAVVMTELEARMLANRDLVDRIEVNRQDSGRMVRGRRRS